MSKARPVRNVIRRRGPAYPVIFYTCVGAACYYGLSVLGFYYVDERDYQAAKAEEDRQAWSRTAEGQAQLADLAAKDAARQAAELKRQLEMMETESGRQELANERKVQVADLRHREMKLIFDLANKQRDIDRSRQTAFEDAEKEAIQRRAREAAGPLDTEDQALKASLFGFGWGGKA